MPPVTESAMVAPSTVMRIEPLPESAPKIFTSNSRLYWPTLFAETVTPGSNMARFRKLRPLSGRFSISWRVITPPIVWLS